MPSTITAHCSLPSDIINNWPLHINILSNYYYSITSHYISTPTNLHEHLNIVAAAFDVMFQGKINYSIKLRINGNHTVLFEIKVRATHLDEVVCVISAIDTDGVFERGAVGWGKQQQFEAFCCCHAEGLANQREASELLGEHAAHLSLQLAVKWLRHQLVSEQQHVLTYTRERGESTVHTGQGREGVNMGL